MFSYYGCKNRIARHYPPPQYDLIVEPFAGAAFYSVKHGLGKRVILADRYKVICDIWNYLINATERQIRELPEPTRGTKVRDLPLTDTEKHLVYFMSSRANALPLNTVGQWNSCAATKRRIIECLPGIRNWRVKPPCSYDELPNDEATWFIDPPYAFGGHRYKFPNRLIDYAALGARCAERKGQVIVCENSKASWLPFAPLYTMRGQKHVTQEVMWSPQR